MSERESWYLGVVVALLVLAGGALLARDCYHTCRETTYYSVAQCDPGARAEIVGERTICHCGVSK